MKRFFRQLACAALALLLFSAALAESDAAPAQTDPSSFAPIRALLAALDEAEIPYQDLSPSSSGEYGHIAVLLARDEQRIVFSCFASEFTLHIYGWKLVTVDSDKLLKAYETINALNAEQRWGTFVLDTTDNTVQIEYDMI